MKCDVQALARPTRDFGAPHDLELHRSPLAVRGDNATKMHVLRVQRLSLYFSFRTPTSHLLSMLTTCSQNRWCFTSIRSGGNMKCDVQALARPTRDFGAPRRSRTASFALGGSRGYKASSGMRDTARSISMSSLRGLFLASGGGVATETPKKTNDDPPGGSSCEEFCITGGAPCVE